MTVQELYITSAHKLFSTFLDGVAAPQDTKKQAELLFLSLFKHLGKEANITVSPEQIEKISQEINVSKESSALLTQFIQKFSLSQAEVLLTTYLLALNDSDCSLATIKNYRSDINQFLHFTNYSDLSQTLTKQKVLEFIRAQHELQLSGATVKRKLVSLAQFGLWLESTGAAPAHSYSWLVALSHATFESHPVKEITTETPQKRLRLSLMGIAHGLSAKLGEHNTNKSQEHSEQIKQNLRSIQAGLQKKTDSFISQYANLAMMVLFLISFVYFGYQQFIVSPEKPLAFPTTLTRPTRTLSFQGRLTDTAQNPVTSATNFRFKLYDSGPSTTGGTQLWDSGTCSVTPDQDGIFSSGLGSDCGSEIDSSVFSENANVWLQVQVGAEILSPRQSIKSVAYALNSETLQGFPPADPATPNTVVVMNNSGEVVLGGATPKLKASSTSLTLEGTTLNLQTASGSNGNIVLDPDGLGQIIAKDYIAAPGATLSATYAGGTALTLNAGPSATADIMKWQTSAGGGLGVITASGNIGIGTTSTRATLDVAGDASTSGSLVFRTGTSSIDVLNGQRLDFNTSPGGDVGLAAKMTILNNGNVGIGTTNPGYSLEVTGNGTGYFAGQLTTNSWLSTKYGLFSTATNPSIQIDANNSGAGTLTLGQAGDGDTLIIEGSVGIGTTVPSQSLHIANSMRLTGGFYDSVNSPGASGYILKSTGSATQWVDGNTLFDIGWFDNTANALHPRAEYAGVADLVLGSNATASAKFAVMNINSGTPTATMSGNFAIASPLGNNPANTITSFDGGTLDLRTSVGGDVGATSRMFIANNGLIGIGTTAPSQILDINGDLRVRGNDITDSGDVTRISLGATTTLTNTTTTLSGTTTITASSLSSFTTASALAMNSTTSLTLGNNATVYGSSTADGDLTLQGTSDATRTTSYVLLQPTAGNVGIGTTAATEKLQITNGNIKATNTTSPYGVGFYSTNNVYLADNQYLDIAAGVYKAASNGTSNRLTVSYSNGFQFFNGATTTADSPVTNTESMRLSITGGLSLGSGYVGTNPGAGSMIVSGNVGIGTTNPSSFKLQTSGNVGPTTTATYDLGSNSLRWNNIYGTTIYQGANQVCDTSGNCSNAGLWQNNQQAFHPRNEYAQVADILVGGNSTASADFRVTGLGNGTTDLAGYTYGRRFIDIDSTGYYVEPGNVTTSGLFAGSVGIGTTTASQQLTITGSLLANNAASRIAAGSAGYLSRVGIYSSPTFTDSSTAVYGINSSATVSNSNTSYNAYYESLAIGAGATIDAAYGMHVTNPTGTGSLTDNYGVYVDSLTKGSTNYAVYTAGTTPSYFGGNIGVGTTSINNRIELPDHVAATGGIGIGTDVDLYRSAADILSIGSGDSLAVGGTTVITSSRYVQTANGTAGGPSHTFTGDATSGMFLPSAGNLGLSSNGGERIRIDNAGNVGINTTNPTSFKLQVTGSVGPTTTATYDLGSNSLKWNNIYGTTIYQGNNQVCDSSGNCTTSGLWQRTNEVFHPRNEWASVVDIVVGGNSTASADFRVTGLGNGTTDLAGYTYGRRFIDIDSSGYYVEPGNTTTSALFAGNVGIGTTTTTGALATLESTAAQLRLNYTSAVNTTLSTDSSGYLNLNSTGNRINLGAGTYYLSETGTASNLHSVSLNRSSGTGYTIPDIYGVTDGLVVGGTSAGGGTIALNTSSGATPTMYLTGTSVGIGTTSPGDRLEVYGLGSSGSIVAHSSGNTARRSGLVVGTNNTGVIFRNDGTSHQGIRSDGSTMSFMSASADGYNPDNWSGTPYMLINSSGNVGINTTNPSSFKLQTSGNVGPTTTATYDLGSNSLRWNNIYGTTIYQGANQVCDTSGNCSNAGLWQNNQQAIHPRNEYAQVADIIVGSDATASADFRVTGLGNGTTDLAGYTYGRRFIDIDSTGYYVEPGNVTTSGLFAGSVGIGTTGPLGPLNVHESAGGDDKFLVLSTSYGGGNNFGINPFIYGVDNGGFEIRDLTNNASRLVIAKTTGSVGIGSTSPHSFSKLDVVTSATSGGLFGYDGTGGVLIGYAGSTIQGRSGGALGSNTDLYVNPYGGNVGIGTTTTGAKLEINSTAQQLRLRYDGTYYLDVDQNTISAAAQRLRLNPSNGQNVTLVEGGSGNVGIGTTTPTQRLDVNGTIRSRNGIRTPSHFDWSQRSGQFTDGLANQVAYVNFGNNQMWGWVEISLTDAYSSQNTIGKYTKRYYIGRNVAGASCGASSEVPAAFGPVATQWKLGDCEVDGSNNVRIPIYHLVTTGNAISVYVEGEIYDTGGQIDAILSSLQITTPTTVANSQTRDYVNIADSNVGIGTTTPTSFKLEIAGSIGPTVTDTYDLGSATKIWNDAYVDRICFDGGSDCITNSNAMSGYWQLASNVLSPDDALNDLAIGGSTVAASMFGIDESAGNFYLGYDNSANPTLNFEATDGDAGEFGFNTNDSFFFSNANVGIGTTNPGYKLQVNGDIGTNYNSIVLNPSGGSVATDGTYGIYWHNTAGAPNASYGIYRTAGAWTASTYQQLKINFETGIQLGAGTGVGTGYDKSYVEVVSGKGLMVSSGNVGIGTTGPATKLNVVGGRLQLGALATIPYSGTNEIGIDASAATQAIRIYQDATHGLHSAWIYNATPANSYALIEAYGGNNPLVLQNAGGNVGIGTTAPGQKLDIRSTNTSVNINLGSTTQTQYSNFILNSDTGTAQIWKAGSGYASYGGPGALNIYNSQDKPITFYQNTTERMRVDSGGNIGIGTNAPIAKLQVEGPILGTMLSTNWHVGIDHNILYNATARYTVSQSGPAPFTLASLFDGYLGPMYTATAPSVGNPQIITISGLDGNHTQSPAYAGWTTRYWAPLKFKIEGYDTYAGYNNWRTIADYSASNYTGGQEFMTALPTAGGYTQLRITIYTCGGTSGECGIGELFFIKAEDSRPYAGLLPSSMWEGAAGNVGIGTTTPTSFKLEIAGSIGPTVTDTYDLGSATKIWSDVYADRICFDGGTDCITNSDAMSGYWQLLSGVLSPDSATNDLAIGGSTVAASMFGIDESAGNFYLGYDNTANPTLNFEATDADAGEFGFNTNDSFFFSNASVGIGTTAPLSKFDVIANGTALAVADNFGTAGNFESTTPTGQSSTLSVVGNDALAANIGGVLGFGGRYNATGYANWASIKGLKTNATSGDYSGYLSFFTRLTGAGSVERMRIDNTGNVGIGTTAPQYKVHVNAATTIPNARTLNFYTLGSEIYPVNTFMTVGQPADNAATTAPTAIGLLVNNDSKTDNTYAPLIGWGNRSNSDGYSQLSAGIAGKRTTQGLDANWHGGELHFYTGSRTSYGLLDRMMINDSGSVGIGTTGPGVRLDVQSADNTAATNIGSFFAANRTQAVGIGYQDVRQQAAGIQLNVNAGTTGVLYLGNTSTGGVNIAAGGGNVTFPGTGVWTSGGNVGVGTSGPTIKLAVGDTDTGLHSAGDGLLDIYSNNVNTMSIRSGNVGIGSTSPGSKLDVNGYVRSKTGYLDRNMLDTTVWTVGTGSVGGFGQNGSTSENDRFWSTDPWGKPGIVWRSVNDAASDGDGGWNYNNIPVSANKAYRSTVWVKKTGTTSGTVYFGLDGGTTLNLSNVPDGNPYFFGLGSSNLIADRWYLFVGYVHANNDASTTSYSAVYDGVTGLPIAYGTDFKNSAAATVQTHRTYNFYDTVAGSIQYFYGPRFEEIDGNEPSIQELIGSISSGSVQVGEIGRPGYSCLDILKQRPGAPSGNYYISPNSSAVYQVYCDMTTEGGGWTFFGHVNSDSAGGSFFTTPQGSYQINRADNGAMYSLGLLDDYPDTETMVTLDSADPATANAASKIVFYKYGITHPAFQTGPITCSGLVGPPYFQYKTSIGGAYTEGGTSNDCSVNSWYPRTAGNSAYLALFSAGGNGNYWGSGMGGNSTWGHDGWWYFRETSLNGGSLAIGTTDPGTSALAVMGGNVGIGTNTPPERLFVSGNATVDAYNSFKARYTTNANYQGHLSWDHVQLGNNGPNYLVAGGGGGTGAGGSLAFVVNNTNELSGLYADSNKNGLVAMTINTTGNVGIGTTDPDAQMSGTQGIAINKTNYPAVGFKNSTTSWLWYGTGSTLRMWNVSAGDVMSANTSGSVGIGTTSPRSRLDVTSGLANIAGDTSDVANFTGANQTPTNGNLSVNTNNAQAVDIGGSIALGGLYRAGARDNATFGVIKAGKTNSTDSNYSGYLAFGTRNSGSPIAERMRIDNTGNVGIGTSGPTAKLHVNGGDALISGDITATNAYLAAGTTAGDGGELRFGGNQNYAYYGILRNSTTPLVTSATTPGSFKNYSRSLAFIESGSSGFGLYGTYDTIKLYNNNAGVQYYYQYNGVTADTPIRYRNANYSGTDWEAWRSIASQEWTNTRISGTTNYVAKFTGANTIGNSTIFDNGTNVGIGTTSPLTNLHITGSTAFDSTTGLNIVNGSNDYGRTHLRLTGRIQAGNDGWSMNGRANILFAANANASGVGLGAIGTDKFAIQYQMLDDKLGILSSTGGATPLMVFQQNGNVGIGTTAPKARLHVQSTAASEYPGASGWAGASQFISNLDPLYGLYTGVSGTGRAWMQVGRNDSATYYDLILQPNGAKVGVGTTSPTGIFSVGSNNEWYVSTTNPNTLNTAGSTNGLADGWVNYRGYNDGFTQFRNFNVGDGKGTNIAWFDGTNRRVSINNGQTANHTLGVNGTLWIAGAISGMGNTDHRGFSNLASFSYDAGNLTGYMIIQTGVPQDQHTMVQVTIDLYGSYGTPASTTCQLVVSGYWSSEGNGGLQALGHTNVCGTKYEVQVARNTATGNVAIILGNSGTVWSYPKVYVSRAVMGYGIADSYADGWTISTNASIAGYSNNDTVADVTAIPAARVTAGTFGAGNFFFQNNVGIGTTTASISLAVGDSDSGLHSSGDGQLNIYSNNNNTISVRTGTVGIGTTSPNTTLNVYGTSKTFQVASSATAQVGLYFSNGSNDLYIGGDSTQDGDIQIKNSAGNSVVRLHSGTQGQMAIYSTGGVEHAQITTDGTKGKIRTGLYTNNNIGLCHVADGSLELIVDCSSAPTDLAEYFGTSDTSIEAGDLVSATGEAYEVPEPNTPGKITTKAFIKKTTGAYEQAMIGIISTDPNTVYGGDGVFADSENPRPVSMAGRVPTKVSTINGPIKVGDRLTASPIAGVAMKATQAGWTVAIALDNYDEPGVGKIITFVKPSWYDPNSYILNEGELVLTGANQDYTVTPTNASPLQNMIAGAQAVLGKIRSGIIYTKELFVTERASVASLDAGTITTQTATVSGTLSANVATVETLNAETLSVAGSLTASGTSQLGALVADSATISGELVVQDLVVTGSTRLAQIQAQQAQLESVKATTAELFDATISGTLYAENIADLDAKIASAIQQPSFIDLLTGNEPAPPPAANPISVYDPVIAAGYTPINPSFFAENEGISLAAGDVILDSTALFVRKYLEVNGVAYVTQALGIGESLTVGAGTTITDGIIAYTGTSPESTVLQIQPSGQGKIELLAGLLKLENGVATINGDLTIAGKTTTQTLLTNLIQPADFGNPFQVQVAGVSTESGEIRKSRFEIIDELGTPVATISAEGKANFAGGIGVGSESLVVSSSATSSSATTVAQKTSGKVTIPAGTNEVIIESENISDSSLIYVTPVGSTQNQVLYVKSQTAENTLTPEKEGKFVVGFDAAVSADINLNWWIVN